jgi:hypothetical protein
MQNCKVMRQMPGQPGRAGRRHGEAGPETASDEAGSTLHEHPDTGSAKSKAGTGGLLESGADETEPASGMEAGQGQQRCSRGGRTRHRANCPGHTHELAQNPPRAVGRQVPAQSGTQGDDSQTRREPARAGHPHGAGSTDPASTVASAATPDRSHLQRTQPRVSSWADVRTMRSRPRGRTSNRANAWWWTWTWPNSLTGSTTTS